MQYANQVAPILGAQVGKRMREIRERLYITQTQAAQALGVTQSWLSKAENGKLAYAPFSLEAFRALFGAYVTYILTGEEGRV